MAANGNGPVAGMPTWLQPAVQLVTTLGVPTVFAGILLWFVLTKLDSALRIIMQNEETRTAKLVQIETGFVHALDRQTLAFNQTIQGNIAAIDRQTKMFEESIKENIDAVNQNATINRQTTETLQRMLNQQGRPAP